MQLPGSNNENQHVIAQWMTEINPLNVVDVGAGAGKYAKRYKKPRTHWTAVEAFAPYVKEYQLNKLYDRVIVADARYVGSEWLNADLVIFGDILEHMQKDEAMELMDVVMHDTETQDVIVQMPIVKYPQGEVNGNPFEVHVKDDWNHGEVVKTWNQWMYKWHKGNETGCYWLKKNGRKGLTCE